MNGIVPNPQPVRPVLAAEPTPEQKTALRARQLAWRALVRQAEAQRGRRS